MSESVWTQEGARIAVVDHLREHGAVVHDGTGAHKVGIPPLSFGESGTYLLDGGEILIEGLVPKPQIRRLSDLARWEASSSAAQHPPYFVNTEEVHAALRDRHDPVLYHAYRDILPPRPKATNGGESKPATFWYADLITYFSGVLPGGELFRSTGHWNKSAQLEIFQTLQGSVLIVVCGYNGQGEPHLYQQVCGPGDMCSVPPGFWHITYVLDGPALVFNIYTDSPHLLFPPRSDGESPAAVEGMTSSRGTSPKYHVKPPVEIGAVRGEKGVGLHFSPDARSAWGGDVPLLHEDPVVQLLAPWQWLTQFHLFASAQQYLALEAEYCAQHLAGRP